MLRADVAYALVRAVSRHFSTHGRVQQFSRRREKSRRGTHECVRHIDGVMRPITTLNGTVLRWFERI